MLFTFTKTSFAQQITGEQKTETVVYKLQKTDYQINGVALQNSLGKLNGVTVTMFCDQPNKVFLIMQVNRSIQPNDDNIIVALNTSNVGFKKLEDSLIQNTINFCN
jgi:hypothetical protein